MTMKFWSIFVAVSMLAGCSTAPSVSVESPDSRISDNAGLVAVQVIGNSERVSRYLWDWTAIFLAEDRPGAEPLYLQSLDGPTMGTTAFVGAVPPGNYRLLMLQAYQDYGDTSYRLRVALPAFIGKFEVATGRLTNLGTLVAQPLAKVLTQEEREQRYAVTRSDKPAEMREFIRDRLPKQHAVLKSEEDLGWLPDAYGSVRTALLDAIRKRGLPRGALALGAPGELLSYGRLGQIYFRSSAGSWTRRALPGDHEIFSAVRMLSGLVALGGERGVVYVSSPPHSEFALRRVPDAAGSVFDIREAEPGTLVAFILHRDRIRVMSSGDTGLTWKDEHGISRQKPGFFFSVSFPIVMREPDGTLITHMDGLQHRRARGSGTWTQTEGPEYTRLVAQRNGTLVGVLYDAWSGEKSPQYSTDGGHNWTKTKIPSVWLAAAGTTPYVFSDHSILTTGRYKDQEVFDGWKPGETIPLVLGTDNGKTIKSHGKVPPGCDRLRGEISTDDLIFALCADGRMLSSRDHGRTFQQEFDPTITSADVDKIIGQLPGSAGETH